MIFLLFSLTMVAIYVCCAGFTKIDSELREPNRLEYVALMVVAAVFYTIIVTTTDELYVSSYITVYVVFSIYCDIRMKLLYTCVNYVSLTLVVIAYMLICGISWYPIGISALYIVLSKMKLYGSGDSYVFAVVSIYLSMFSSDVISLNLLLIIASCLLFIMYSLVISVKDKGVNKKRAYSPAIVISCLLISILM